MFTFGIFSTHIPYIAFVVFYAYFLITGVEKASKGEFQSGKNVFTTEQFAETHFDLNDTSGNYYHTNPDINSYAYFEIFSFKQKIIHGVDPSVLMYHSEFYTPLANRPPPSYIS